MNYLKYDDIYLSNTKNLTLISFDKNYSSLTNHSKGVWYFEYSHKTGSNLYVIGYSSGPAEVTAIPNGEFQKLFAYSTEFTSFNNITSSKGNMAVDLNITTEYDKHIGVGIDIDNHNIFYIYENILISFHFENSAKEWSVIAREANVANCNDTVDIFFERKDFAYNPPFNALPWYSHIKLTCELSRQHLYLSYIFYAIFIL